MKSAKLVDKSQANNDQNFLHLTSQIVSMHIKLKLPQSPFFV